MLNMLDPDEEPTLILTALEVSPDAIVNEYAPIAEIRARMVELGAAAVAVVDLDNCLRGIVRRSDLANAGSAACAADVMIDFEYARVCGRTGRIDVYFNSCHVSCAAR